MNFKFQFLFSHCNRSKNYFQTECNSLCRWPFLLWLLNRNDILLLSDTNTNKCNTKTTVSKRTIDLHISNIKHLRLVPVPTRLRWATFDNGILSVWQTLLSFCWISDNFLYTWNINGCGISIVQFCVFQQIHVERNASNKFNRMNKDMLNKTCQFWMKIQENRMKIQTIPKFGWILLVIYCASINWRCEIFSARWDW